MDTKMCSRCGEVKHLSAFGKRNSIIDGRQSYCRDCKKKYYEENKEYLLQKSHEHYENNIEYYAEYNKQYRESYIGRKKHMDGDFNYKNNHPERYKAKYLVSNAVRDGKLKKQPCRVCGSDETQAHHEDYSKPLEVVWLCEKHHMEAHGKRKRLSDEVK